jgi:hypothetical protein
MGWDRWPAGVGNTSKEKRTYGTSAGQRAQECQSLVTCSQRIQSSRFVCFGAADYQPCRDCPRRRRTGSTFYSWSPTTMVLGAAARLHAKGVRQACDGCCELGWAAAASGGWVVVCAQQGSPALGIFGHPVLCARRHHKAPAPPPLRTDCQSPGCAVGFGGV